jgi:hypothetical protein
MFLSGILRSKFSSEGLGYKPFSYLLREDSLSGSGISGQDLCNL